MPVPVTTCFYDDDDYFEHVVEKVTIYAKCKL